VKEEETEGIHLPASTGVPNAGATVATRARMVVVVLQLNAKP